MNLLDAYEAAVAAGDINDDPEQRQVLTPLETLRSSLLSTKKSWFSWGRKALPSGVYLYGAVGVGKTFLMDLFFDNVEIMEKKRFHFHHFMQQIDAQLRQLQGQKNPLKHIAAKLAKTTQLLCFDEFMVDDVAYAMILAELLQALFNQGLVLVATSNTRPDDLYLKGVHRKRFLPAIAAIKAHCQVLKLNEQQDYRLGREVEMNTYLYPLNETTTQQMTLQFAQLAPEGKSAVMLEVQNRQISTLRCAQHVVWFDFRVICNLPRSQLDYLEIARRFDTIFVSDIPVLGENDTVFAILLINFIDVMYDQGIILILSAAVPIPELYLKGEMSQEFKRTASRLQEMQSIDYRKRHPRRATQEI